MMPAKPRNRPSGESGENLHRGILLRAPAADLAAWRAAARAEGVTVSEWLRRAAAERLDATPDDSVASS